MEARVSQARKTITVTLTGRTACMRVVTGISPTSRLLFSYPSHSLILIRRAAKALMSGDLVRPSNPLVSKLSLGWMQTLCLWKELHQVGVAKRGSTASLRMEDFTGKVRSVSVTSDWQPITKTLCEPAPLCACPSRLCVRLWVLRDVCVLFKSQPRGFRFSRRSVIG